MTFPGPSSLSYLIAIAPPRGARLGLGSHSGDGTGRPVGAGSRMYGSGRAL